MLNLTPVVKNLLIINFFVYLAHQIIPESTMGWLWLHHVATPYFKPYQLFTYMFCHQGFWHFFMNMLFLVFFGPILEEFWGQKKFVIFYTIAGLGAGAFNILIDLMMNAPSFGVMLGASGAVYGVMTAFGIIFPNMELRLLFLPISFKAKYMVLVLGSMAIYYGFRGSAPGDNTAHLAHLGGIVVAMIFLQFWRGR